MIGAGRSGDRELVLRTMWEINVSPAFAADERERQRFVERALRAGWRSR